MEDEQGQTNTMDEKIISTALEAAQGVLNLENVIYNSKIFNDYILQVDLELRISRIDCNHPIWDAWVRLLRRRGLDGIAHKVAEMYNHIRIQEQIIHHFERLTYELDNSGIKIAKETDVQELYRKFGRAGKDLIDVTVPADLRKFEDYQIEKVKIQNDNT